LQTLEDISHRKSVRLSAPEEAPGRSKDGMPKLTAAVSVPSMDRSPVSASPEASLRASVAGGPVGASTNPGCWRPRGLGCSMNATWRQVLAPSAPVLS